MRATGMKSSEAISSSSAEAASRRKTKLEPNELKIPQAESGAMSTSSFSEMASEYSDTASSAAQMSTFCHNGAGRSRSRTHAAIESRLSGGGGGGGPSGGATESPERRGRERERGGDEEWGECG